MAERKEVSEKEIHNALDTNDGFCHCGKELVSIQEFYYGDCWECR